MVAFYIALFYFRTSILSVFYGWCLFKSLVKISANFILQAFSPQKCSIQRQEMRNSLSYKLLGDIHSIRILYFKPKVCHLGREGKSKLSYERIYFNGVIGFRIYFIIDSNHRIQIEWTSLSKKMLGLAWELFLYFVN